MRRHLVVMLALTCAATPLAAQSTAPAPSDSLLDRLIGHWVLRGPMAGQQVTHDVTFAWVLNHEYVQMLEVSREKTATGAPAYEAIVYIHGNPGRRSYTLLWLDNTEAAPEFSPIGRATADGDSIPFSIRSSATDVFHNTFVYDRSSDTWQWHMDNEQSGARRMFARVTLTRE